MGQKGVQESQISTNEPLNPIASSAIDRGLVHPSSPNPNGHYAPSTTYTHSPMPPLPRHKATNGTAYRLNHASWYGPNRDRQRVDHLPSLRGFVPGAVHSLGAYQDDHAHSSQTHEDGFSEPPVWSSPAGRMDASLAYNACPFPAASRSNGRTSIPNDPLPPAGLSPYSSSQNSATYNFSELPPFGYFQWPPQPTTVFGVCSTHLVTFHPFCLLLGGYPHLARPSGAPVTHGITDHPLRLHFPRTPYLSHPALYSPIPHPNMPCPYMAPQSETKKAVMKRGRKKRGGRRRSGAERR